MNPIKYRYVQGITVNKTDAEIMESMKKLTQKGKGKGNDMYDALAKILEERHKK